MAEHGSSTQAEVADLRFGIFDWIDQNRSLSLADTYEDRLKLLEYADEAEFWCYHLAEHHGTPLGLAWRRRRTCSSRPPPSAPRGCGWGRSSSCCLYTTLCATSRRSASSTT
jgi:hypothetical protein